MAEVSQVFLSFRHHFTQAGTVDTNIRPEPGRAHEKVSVQGNRDQRSVRGGDRGQGHATGSTRLAADPHVDRLGVHACRGRRDGRQTGPDWKRDQGVDMRNFDWGHRIAHLMGGIIEALIILVAVAVLAVVVFLLVRYLLVATRAAQLYVDQHEPPRPVRGGYGSTPPSDGSPAAANAPAATNAPAAADATATPATSAAAPTATPATGGAAPAAP